MFGGARLESGEVGGPDGQGGVLEGTRGHGRGVADAETGRLFILLLEILLGESSKFCAVFLLYGAPFTVELLYVFEPGNAIGDPSIGRFEAILLESRPSARDLVMGWPGLKWKSVGYVP